MFRSRHGSPGTQSVSFFMTLTGLFEPCEVTFSIKSLTADASSYPLFPNLHER